MSIRDLARALDISIGTVSRALNDRADVNPETRRRVLEAAAAMGYAPNQSGRSLRQGTTNAVAFMIPNDHDVAALGNSFFMSVSDGLQPVLMEAGLDLFVLLCPSEMDKNAFLRRVVERRIADGVIISSIERQDSRIDYLVGRNVPFVALGRSLSGGAHAWVDLDFEGVIAQSVSRLARLGHRRIAFSSAGGRINFSFIFAEAYRRALEAEGLSFDPALMIREDGTEEGGYRLGDRLLAMPEPPGAVILADETMAIGLYRRLYEAGLTPGRDLAVIGFRDSPHCRFLSPPLTCFRLSLHDLGRRLGEIMLERLKGGGGADRPPQEIWPMELVAGESDGRPSHRLRPPAASA
ncbi:transcriptional regulator, LacI family [Faunimonas pinastri]|uniref:Transcriptional regulator, LacI family n=1 Tax=Faunimonas pinastri TaxID=1855383 RepID=A0A1H9IER0_9HYPH|nr:LacI family DNA-binding transcriptional regulator [Faunimonas pinastri]SEQ73073.1 transcriptional regulator, LacI family [Faunimonas pinastri]